MHRRTAPASSCSCITISNPNDQAVTLTSIRDTLPAGFSYRPGTTQEPNGQTDNPAISGQNLTFAGPYTMPANGSIVLQFGVTVSTIPGEYFNEAAGESASFTVAPSGPTAPITVTLAPSARMVGKGSAIGFSDSASYAYILRCGDNVNTNAPFEVRFNSRRQRPDGSFEVIPRRFRATSANTTCIDDPGVPTPAAGFDTMTGVARGTLSNSNFPGGGTVQFRFVDGGPEGARDSVNLTIRDATANVEFSGFAAPPAKLPGSDQATGNNTAQAGGGTRARAPPFHADFTPEFRLTRPGRSGNVAPFPLRRGDVHGVREAADHRPR